MSYWEDRAKSREDYTEDVVKQYYNDLVGNYNKAQKEIQQQMSDFYLKYMENNKLTYAEMQQMLNPKELKEFKSTLEEFRAMAENSFGTYNKELNNISIKARVSRLQALESNIKAQLDQLYGQTQKATQKCLETLYKEQYLHTLYDIDKFTGLLHSFSDISEEEIKSMLTYPYGGLSFSERIWRQQGDLVQKLKQTFINNSLMGRNPYQYAKELSKMFDTKKYEAYRLLYTEGAYVTERATMKAYKNDGIEKYQILATLDSHTSEICQEKDDMIFEVGKEQQGVNFPPFHPFCRTTTVPYFEDLDTTRIARDEEGKQIYVPGDMKYEEWK